MSSSACGTPASGVPACGTNVMTRTCSHAASRIAAMERARSASVSPIPVRIPSSTSRPARRAARRAGLLVEDGILTGIGDTEADRARSIAAMREAAWEQVRVMTFVPQAGTPLAGVRPAERDIDEGRRTVAGVLPHLARLGLRPATVADYRTWLAAAHARAKVPA